MMILDLNAIEKSCLRTGGGLKQIALIDPADLAVQPKWYVVPNVEELSFLPGKAAYAFQHTLFSARVEDETSTDNIAGDFFSYRLTAFIRVIRGEVELLRSKLINRRIHTIVTYMDDSQRFFPLMRLTGRGDSGAKYGRDAPGVTFTGLCRLLRPAPFVAGTFNIIGGPYVPPGSGGDGSVMLVELTVTDAEYTYTVPEGKWLAGWEVRSTEAQTPALGLTPSGSELGGPVDVGALQVWVGDGNMTPTFADLDIYFSGLAGTNSIRLWLLG